MPTGHAHRVPYADDAIFEGCDAVVERTFANQRLAPMPMEGRAAAAWFADGKLTYWVSTQNAQISRFILAGALGMDPATIRVITPDVGGGFGAKVGIDRDAIPGRLGGQEDRRGAALGGDAQRELVGMTHGRAQEQTIKLGRHEGRPGARLPARRGAGHRRVPADERFPARSSPS